MDFIFRRLPFCGKAEPLLEGITPLGYVIMQPEFANYSPFQKPVR